MELILEDGQRVADYLAPLRAARGKVMSEIVEFLKSRDVIEVDEEDDQLA